MPVQGLGRDGTGIIDLGELRDIEAENKCDVCSLFRKVAITVPSQLSSVYHLRAFTSLTLLRLSNQQDRLDSSPDIVLAIVEGERSKAHYSTSIYRSILRGAIVPVDDVIRAATRFMHRGRQLDPTLIDYEKLRSCISVCESTAHPLCQMITNVHMLGLRVINCRTKRIVPLVPGDKYLALSYVWGAASPQTGRKQNQDVSSLSEPVGQTIRDALQATIELGFDFLWVDKYCIDQSEEHSMVQQIGKMDQIFEGATATIVAAAGDNACAGLPGVSNIARSEQPSASSGEMQLIFTLPHVSHLLSHSRWAERAWTYQEGLLSRRCLFFTSAQVYFVCRSASWCESIDHFMSTKVPIAREDRPFPLLGSELFSEEAFSSSRVVNRARPQFARNLGEYTSRSLTYQIDALNAFRGMLGRANFSSFHGIPIVPNTFTISLNSYVNVGFALGLLWHTVQTPMQTKHGAFPSWSWASSMAEARYPPGLLGSSQDSDMHFEGTMSSNPPRFGINVDKTLAQLYIESAGRSPISRLLSEKTIRLLVHGDLADLTLDPRSDLTQVERKSSYKLRKGGSKTRRTIYLDAPNITDDNAASSTGKSWKSLLVFNGKDHRGTSISAWMLLQAVKTASREPSNVLTYKRLGLVLADGLLDAQHRMPGTIWLE